MVDSIFQKYFLPLLRHFAPTFYFSPYSLWKKIMIEKGFRLEQADSNIVLCSTIYNTLCVLTQSPSCLSLKIEDIPSILYFVEIDIDACSLKK